MKRIEAASAYLAVLGVVIAIVLLSGARYIAPPIFDPVGSAALPRVCAVALLGTCVGLLLQSALRQSPRPAPKEGAGLQPATMATFGVMAGYIAAMGLGLGFTLSTVLFISFAIPAVARSWKVAPVAVVIGIVMGFACEWIFTSIFFVELPRML